MEEVLFIDMMDPGIDSLLYQATVDLFQWGKATDIKRLKVVGGMSRHLHNHNIISCTVLIKFWGNMATVAIKD